MRAYLARAPRITANIEITILLVKTGSGNAVSETVPAILCNISERSGCIEVVSPLVSGHHLFYQTLNSDTYCLLLQGHLPGQEATSFSIQANSVWMKTTDEECAPGFRIGLRFRARQTELFREFQRLPIS